MPDDVKTDLPSPVLAAFARLHKVAMGVAVGTATGLGLMLMTFILLIEGGYPIGPNLALLGQFFIGYTVTFPGAFIGFAWGFASGFVVGWSFALLHNLLIWLWLVMIRSKAEMEQYGDFLDHM